MTDAQVEELAEKASAAFFAVVAAHLPPDTPGDIDPGASYHWDETAKSFIRMLEENVPGYYDD